MIKSITVKDYKEFKYLELTNLKRINIIIGKNGVGKTNLLNGFHSYLSTVNYNSTCLSQLFMKNFYDGYELDSFIENIDDLNKKYIINCLKSFNIPFDTFEEMLKINYIKFSGMGIKKLLYLLYHIYNSKTGTYLFIDDIDVGFHHSVMHNIWKVIKDLIIKKDIFIVCTTHSLEFIMTLFHVNGFPYEHEMPDCRCKWCGNNDEKFYWYNKDLVSIYRLERYNTIKKSEYALASLDSNEPLNYPINAVNIDSSGQIAFCKFDWEMR